MQDALTAGTRRTVGPVPAGGAVAPGIDLTGLKLDG